MYALSSSTAPVAETPAPVTAMARAYARVSSSRRDKHHMIAQVAENS